jgi:uncharacterized protein (TIGR03086 family)
MTINQAPPETDVRFVFAKAVATGTAVIGAVQPTQLADPTPCDQFTVRQLLGHLVDVLGRVAIVGRGGEPMSASVGINLETTPDDGWTDAWLAAAHDVQAAWSDDASLTQTVVLPWATQSGAEALAMWTNEIIVHTWDLATATGNSPVWDERALVVALDAIRQQLPSENRAAMFEAARQGMPEGMRDFPPPFAEAVTVPDDAPLIDKVVAWNGRNPRRG